MPLIDWFRRVASTPDAEAALEHLIAHPALLWDARWAEIEAWILAQPTADQGLYRSCLKDIRKLAQEFAEFPGDFPDGAGPIQKLAEKVVGGEWTPSHGLNEAASPEVSSALSPLYVWVTAGRLLERANNGDWQDAVIAFRLLLAAVDALDSKGSSVLVRHAVIGWIDTVCAACIEVPDGRLFRDAVQRAESYLPNETDPDVAALIMQRLGVLHLDPWVSGRDPRRYGNELQTWCERLSHTYGPVVASDPGASLPYPLDALNTAIAWFRLALPHQKGEARGLTLKALAGALRWREILGGEADRDSIRACVTEALGLLRDTRHGTAILDLRQSIAFADSLPANEPVAATGAVPEGVSGGADLPAFSRSAAASPDLLWLEPQDVVRMSGRSEAQDRYVVLMEAAVQDNDPHRAIALGLKLWPILNGSQDEARKRRAFRSLAGALSMAAGAHGLIEESEGDISQLASLLACKARSEAWTAGRNVAALAGVSAALTQMDREDEGLSLLQSALEDAPEAAPALVEPLHLLRAALTAGSAVNAFRAQQWDDATRKYLDAAGQYVRFGLPDTAVEMIERAEDTTFGVPGQAVSTFAIGLANCAAELTASGAPRLADRLQRSWRLVLQKIYAERSVNPNLLWLVLQATKGATFAAALGGARYDWRLDPEATATLSRLARLAGSEGTPREWHDNPLDDELTLVAYGEVVASETSDGSRGSVDDVMQNLRRRFDNHVARRLADGRNIVEVLILGNDLRESLGPRTVLLSHHMGSSESGEPCLATILQTDDGAFAAFGVDRSFPYGILAIENEQHAIEIGHWGAVVASLRREITDEPGPANVVPEAAEKLAIHHHLLLGGGLADKLEELRHSGRNHLCIHSHGPLHFLPMHLLGGMDKPLADDWTVTTIPHPSLIRRRGLDGPPPGRGDRHPIAALGIGFSEGQPHGLPELPGAAEEAKAVAAILRGPCWVNADATEARLQEALSGATRIHIATHGQHDVVAPLFQRLYLYPDASSDGIFNAYEALGMDLRHVDLVTLSACESGLGRYDVSDNPRGLPAALFISGVATIIATLWPIDDRPARLFFETFYTCIAEGTSKLDSFRAAQGRTRQEWPAYRDWGAFQYTGLW